MAMKEVTQLLYSTYYIAPTVNQTLTIIIGTSQIRTSACSSRQQDDIIVSRFIVIARVSQPLPAAFPSEFIADVLNTLTQLFQLFQSEDSFNPIIGLYLSTFTCHLAAGVSLIFRPFETENCVSNFSFKLTIEKIHDKFRTEVISLKRCQ